MGDPFAPGPGRHYLGDRRSPDRATVIPVRATLQTAQRPGSRDDPGRCFTAVILRGRSHWPQGDPRVSTLGTSLHSAPMPRCASRTRCIASGCRPRSVDGEVRKESTHLRLAKPAMSTRCPDRTDTTGGCPPGHGLGIHPEHQGNLPWGQQPLRIHGHVPPPTRAPTGLVRRVGVCPLCGIRCNCADNL